MNYSDKNQRITLEATYMGYIDGGVMFHLENDDMIDFDQIAPKVLSEFNLKSNEYKNQKFEITYSENFDDIDDEDVVIFRLEHLLLL